MTCQDVQRVLPEIMEGGQNREFQTHLKVCPACSELVSDLERIASEARQLAATEEPAPRVWVRIAAELRSEGLIREPELQPARPVLAPPEGRRWNAWWLVPVAAALVVAGSYVVNRKPAPQIADKPPLVAPAPKNAPEVSAQAKDQKSTAQVAQQARPSVIDRAPEEPASSAPMVTVSTEDQQFLDELAQRAPNMRSTYEAQLRAVNSYIREAEAYLKQNPGDEDARRQLMDAYEQKAMLYQMALDRIQ